MIDIYSCISKMNNHKELLIDYCLFFGKMNDVCFFAIDDYKELQELHRVVSRIKSIDSTAKVYCSTYGVDKNNGKPYVYCDCLWIESNIELAKIQDSFSKYDTIGNDLRAIVPCAISYFGDENDDSNIEYVFHENGTIQYYNEFKSTINFNNLICLYWN